jgi:predicted DNA binding CopG/RHH family protein
MAKEREFMSERTRKYSEGEIGDFRIVEDFLPRLEDLVLREDNVKVTLSLSRRSVEFFKREADRARVPYQRMIRALVDAYAARSEGNRSPRQSSLAKRLGAEQRRREQDETKPERRSLPGDHHLQAGRKRR